MKKITLKFALLIRLLSPALSVKAGSTGADITEMNITIWSLTNMVWSASIRR